MSTRQAIASVVGCALLLSACAAKLDDEQAKGKDAKSHDEIVSSNAPGDRFNPDPDKSTAKEQVSDTNQLIDDALAVQELVANVILTKQEPVDEEQLVPEAEEEINATWPAWDEISYFAKDGLNAPKKVNSYGTLKARIRWSDRGDIELIIADANGDYLFFEKEILAIAERADEDAKKEPVFSTLDIGKDSSGQFYLLEQ